jgi:hypothetical protein
VPQRRGDEEDELAPGDGRRERGGVVEVGLEQRQAPRFRRAGDEPPEQPGFLFIPCNSFTLIHHHNLAKERTGLCRFQRKKENI